MYKEDSEVLHGNDQFEGYNMDLIKAISEILGASALPVCQREFPKSVFSAFLSLRLQLHHKVGRGRQTREHQQGDWPMERNGRRVTIASKLINCYKYSKCLRLSCSLFPESRFGRG